MPDPSQMSRGGSHAFSRTVPELNERSRKWDLTTAADELYQLQEARWPRLGSNGIEETGLTGL